MLSSKDKQKPNKPLSEAALRQFIKKAVEREWVREGFHSEVERAYRNISHEDIMHGLDRKDWTLPDPPREDIRGFTYKVRTVDIEGDELDIVVSPNLTTGTLKIVTKC